MVANDNEPTVGSVYDVCLPKILALRERFFVERAAQWAEDVQWFLDHGSIPDWGKTPEDWVVNYPCWRCKQFHYKSSKIGKRHRK